MCWCAIPFSMKITVFALLALGVVVQSFVKRVWHRLGLQERVILGILLLVEGGLMVWQ